MPQKTYMYDTQWNQLINAIGTGDSSAVVTALSTIKTSLDNINTQLDTVGFNSTQWDNLVNAIGTVDIDTTQWNQLINAINAGDTTAISTALTNIKLSLDNINTRLNTVGFNTTQWTNLVNAISSQIITLDLSNINSDNVLNLSNVTGRNITNAFNNLISTLSYLKHVYFFKFNLYAEQQITSTSFVDCATLNNQTIKEGRYMCLWSINATWTQTSYQFNIRLKIGDNLSDIGASVAAAQTNVPVNCRSFINIPTDGDYSVSIQAQVTDISKSVTIEPYQIPTLVLIPC